MSWSEPAAKPIHILTIEDVAETVAWALRPNAPGRVTFDLVHPELQTLAAIITSYRGWLRLKPQPVMTLPRLVTTVTARVADALSWLGWRSPMRTTAITQLAEGINGNPAGWIAMTGITPKSVDEVLAIHPATIQDIWFARLYSGRKPRNRRPNGGDYKRSCGKLANGKFRPGMIRRHNTLTNGRPR
jgi:hypothetical protein